MTAIQLLPLARVAEMFAVHRRTILRHVEAGRFPWPIRLGDGGSSQLLFDQADIERWLAEKKAGAVMPLPPQTKKAKRVRS